jgi:nitroreductase
VDLFEAIVTRRSIKPEKLDARPVERALIERVLEAANWAPSHGLTEPWRFVVFQGEARRALVEATLTTMLEPGEAPIGPGDARRTALEEKVLRVPVTIAIVVSPSSNPKIVEHEELASTAMAVQNLHLAATALGLGGYWTSGKKAFHPAMASFLGLVAPARCLGFFYLGWPLAAAPEGKRRPWQDKVSWRGEP